MWTPTRAQVDAASRHAITIAGTAIAIFGLQAKGIKPEQVTAAITALGSGVNDVVVLIAALAPVYAGLKALLSASPTNQASSLVTTATGPASPAAVEAQLGIVSATSALAADKTVPAADDAKQALIAATIALPEVQTIVTDKKTADAAPSQSVVEAGSVAIIK